MNQFDIVTNKGNSSRNGVPYLMVIQSDSVSALETRIVVPLRTVDAYNSNTIKIIHIPLSVDGSTYIACISEMAAVPLPLLGDTIGNAEYLRTEITAAVDLMFTGF